MDFRDRDQKLQEIGVSMSILKKLVKSVVDTALVPKDVVEDILFLGDGNATEERLKKIKQALADAYEELDE